MTFMSETSPSAGPLSEPVSPVVVGLGANEGDPRLQLAQALRELARQTGSPLRISSLYVSAPIGPHQPDFANCAAMLSFAGDLNALLQCTQGIESLLGRVRRERWGPRPIDIDLLWAGPRAVSSSRLTVPHPELELRAFALLPLLELVPEATSPLTQLPYSRLRDSLHQQRIQRSAPPGWETVAGVNEHDSASETQK